MTHTNSLLSILLATNMVLCSIIHSRRHSRIEKADLDEEKRQNPETECETVWNRAKGEIEELGIHSQYESIKTYSGEILQKKCGRKGHVFDISFCLDVCQLELGDRCNTKLKPGVDMCAPGLTCSNETNRCINQNYGLDFDINDFDFDSTTDLDELLSLLMEK